MLQYLPNQAKTYVPLYLFTLPKIVCIYHQPFDLFRSNLIRLLFAGLSVFVMTRFAHV